MNPLKTTFTLRYEQILSCGGDERVLHRMPVGIQSSVEKKDGCLGYQIEWNGKVDDDLLCFLGEMCAVEAKLIQATVYKFCTVSAVKQLVHTMATQGNDKKGNTGDGDVPGVIKEKLADVL